jgi:hypothetical protein
MLLKYFNSNRLNILVFISLLPAVYWIPSLFHTASPPAVVAEGIPLGRLILDFNRDFRLIAALLALSLVMVNAYLLVQLNIIHIFIPVRTQLPSLFYSVLAIGMIQLHQLTPSLVASTILILVFYRIFNAYKSETVSMNFLDAGMLISLASLVYFPALSFFLFLLASLVILRPFMWREWVFAFLGLLIPYLLLVSVYYLADIPFREYIGDISEGLKRTPGQFKLSQLVNWSFVLVFLLISSFYIATSIDNMKIHARKYFLVFLMFFLVAVLDYFIVPGTGAGSVFVVSVPLSYLFTHYFTKCRKTWMNEILFLLFLLLLFWQRI